MKRFFINLSACLACSALFVDADDSDPIWSSTIAKGHYVVGYKFDINRATGLRSNLTNYFSKRNTDSLFDGSIKIFTSTKSEESRKVNEIVIHAKSMAPKETYSVKYSYKVPIEVRFEKIKLVEHPQIITGIEGVSLEYFKIGENTEVDSYLIIIESKHIDLISKSYKLREGQIISWENTFPSF